MKKHLKKISKILNKFPDIGYEMGIFLYPILSLYFTMPILYINGILTLNSRKDLILFTFIWYSFTVGLYVLSYALGKCIDFIFDKIKNMNN